MARNYKQVPEPIPMVDMLFRLESMGGQSVSLLAFAYQFTYVCGIRWAESMVERVVAAGYARVVQADEAGWEACEGWVILTEAGSARLKALRAAGRRPRPRTVGPTPSVLLGALNKMDGATRV